jgi:hypothetical protein
MILAEQAVWESKEIKSAEVEENLRSEAMIVSWLLVLGY